MKIEIREGEALEISFEGTDGEFIVTWDRKGIRVEADMPDTSGREGVIYHEVTEPELRAKSISKIVDKPIDISRDFVEGLMARVLVALTAIKSIDGYIRDRRDSLSPTEMTKATVRVAKQMGPTIAPLMTRGLGDGLNYLLGLLKVKK